MSSARLYRGQEKNVQLLSRLAAGHLTIKHVRQIAPALFHELSNDYTPTTFTYNLFRIQFENDWNTSEFTRKIGVNRNNMVVFQRAKNLPSSKSIIKICKATGTSIEDFFHSPVRTRRTRSAMNRANSVAFLLLKKDREKLKQSIEQLRQEVHFKIIQFQKKIDRTLMRLSNLSN